MPWRMYGADSDCVTSGESHRPWLKEDENGTQTSDERAQCEVHEVLA